MKSGSASGLVYLNNAATSYPKPISVTDAVRRCLESPPVEPGRTSSSGDPLKPCRETLAALFGCNDPNRVALLPSATQALNLAIRGLAEAQSSGVIVTSVLEHNSVLRPLELLRRTGRFSVRFVRAEADGRLKPEALRRALEGGAAFVVVTCASNVNGALQPIEELAEIAAEARVPLVLDAAQSAGGVPISHADLPGRVFIAFAGHKGLLGPAGTGGLILADEQLPQLVVGGTGVRSERLSHPGELPLRHEAGTPNLPGIVGLEAGAREVLNRGVGELGEHRHRLVREARSALAQVSSVELLPLPENDGRAGIVAFNCSGRSPAEVGYTLAEVFALEVRAGLHCAPLAHRLLSGQRSPGGCVRASFGPFNTSNDVRQLISALDSMRKAA